MKKPMLLIILSVISSIQLHAENFRFNPIPLSDFQTSQQLGGNSRLKISVSLDEAAEVKELKIGGIVICSATACYRPNTISKQDSANALNGTAKLIADAVIPATEITSIYLEELKGANVSGSVALASPLKIESGYYGGEIFVTLNQSGENQSRNYAPSYATSNLLRESGISIYYNPKFPAKVNLGLGVTISMPERALESPTILNAQLTDNGERFPLVDIYPYLRLSKPVVITAKPIENGKSMALAKVRVRTSDANPMLTTSLISEVNKSVSTFGVLNNSFFESSVTAKPQVVAATATSNTACYDLLNQNGATTAIRNTAQSHNGIAYYTGCTDIPPYIHIVYIDLIYGQTKFLLPYNWVTDPSNGLVRQQMRPITEWAPQDWSVAINGFTWAGADGTGPGQTGLTLGYLRSAGKDVGVNRQGGGLYGGTGASDGNKLIMSLNSNYSEGPINYTESATVGYSYPGAVNVISSSTSVLKNDSLCSGDTTRSRWSVIGSGYRGGMVLISSTSDGQTSASELCSVVRLLLGGGNALRLDGGPSAAMTVDGVHVNPLTGLYSFKYGTARYIPQVIQIGI